MATVTLRPNANGDVIQLGQYPSSGYNYDKVDEVGNHDGDATYVYAHQTTWQYDLYQLQDTSVGGGINSVTVYVVHRIELSPSPPHTAYILIKTYGNVYESDPIALTESYKSDSWTLTTNPYTGSAWLWSEINSLQAGWKGSAIIFKQYYYSRLTQLYVVVDYTTYRPRSSALIVG